MFPEFVAPRPKRGRNSGNRKEAARKRTKLSPVYPGSCRSAGKDWNRHDKGPTARSVEDRKSVAVKIWRGPAAQAQRGSREEPDFYFRSGTDWRDGEGTTPEARTCLVFRRDRGSAMPQLDSDQLSTSFG